MIKNFLKCVREFKSLSIITLILIVCEVVIEVFIPFVTAELVNNINQGAPQDQVVKTGIVLVVFACLSLLCGGIAGITCSKASAGFARNLRHDIFKKIQTFSFENIDKFSSASLVTRMTTDVSNVQMAYMMLIRIAVRCPLMFVFSIVMAYIMGGALATTFVVIVPILMTGLYLVSRKAMPAFRSVFRKYDKLNESIEENVRGIRVVKGFSREEHEKDKFKYAADDICRDFTKAERIVAFNQPLMQFCLYFNMAFVLIVGSKMAIESFGEVIYVGQISAMLTYGMQILMSLMMVSMIYVMLTMSSESIKRISEVLEEVPTLKNPDVPVTQVQDGSVDFVNVSFKYSELAARYSLEKVDIHIPSGATVGVIGGTGSGKSTLVQLIARLYDVSVGEVLVGGVNVKNYDIDTLRQNVAMVLQKNLLFSGTIAENLRWGNPDATDAELQEACKLAEAHDFVMSFPDGYDTKIEQGGTNVSGGQKQRLCIARALIKKPKILILDDSTSAVDTKTDAKIRQAFKDFIPDTTKIIIAQRVASVMETDMIIVLDNGRLSDIGTHADLLARNEIYKEIYEQQTRGGDEKND